MPLIMSSHAAIRGSTPTGSRRSRPAILNDLLREQLSYEGVVMTDSIEAAAARATGSTEQIAIRSIRAGNDIVLTTGPGIVDSGLSRTARRGPRVALVPGAREGVRGARAGAPEHPRDRTFVRA